MDSDFGYLWAIMQPNQSSLNFIWPGLVVVRQATILTTKTSIKGLLDPLDFQFMLGVKYNQTLKH